MARCACGNAACSCVVKAGPEGGIIVTGSGSPDRPYEISTVAGGNPLDSLLMVNTPTVEWAQAGEGTIQDKRRWSATAVVKMQELTDVSKTDIPVVGDVVQWNGTEWVFGTPGATAVPVSGVFGVAPLDKSGADSLIGQPIYADSNGQIRTAPMVLATGALKAADPITSYPLGVSVLTITNASGAADGWPTLASGILTTHHRLETATHNTGYQIWAKTTSITPWQMMRVSSGGTWSPWFYVGGAAPHYSANKSANQTMTTANTIYTLTYDQIVTNEGGITYSGGVFTVPITGKYLVEVDQHFQVTGSPTITTYLYKGAAVAKAQSFGAVNANRNVSLSRVVKCVAGDTLTMKARSTVANTIAYGTAGTPYSSIDITLIGG